MKKFKITLKNTVGITHANLEKICREAAEITKSRISLSDSVITRDVYRIADKLGVILPADVEIRLHTGFHFHTVNR